MNVRVALAGLLSLLVLPALARADGPAIYNLDAARSTLTYKVVHKFHEVTGVNKKLQGKAAVKGDQALVQLRAPVEGFDSDNANRDAHMKEAVEAAKFPEVELKGVIKGFALPAKLPGQAKASLEGQLTFHGVTGALSVPVVIDFDAAGNAHAKSEFDVSLDQYKVERPSLMTIKVDDACHITADLQFTK
jgi:polyisoprenoid-binding protein YceI